jgi:hypothetical protein
MFAAGGRVSRTLTRTRLIREIAKSCFRPQARERTEKLTLHVLEIAATKVVPVLIALI